MPAHADLTGSDLHEPKGADTASANTAYVSDGAGSGTWKKLTETSLNIANLSITGKLEFTPGASVTPTDNGDVVFELTSNTSLTVKAKGSDGTVRSVVLTLAP